MDLDEMRTAEKLLKTLNSIDGTLKRIEQLISPDKQHGIIKDAVSHALTGDNHDSKDGVNGKGKSNYMCKNLLDYFERKEVKE